MTRLSVRAPRATRVEVELPSGRRPLEPLPRGYWTLPEPALATGTRYRLRLDAGQALPDPRSNFQPEGVHGPSELHVGTFSSAGTFVSAIAHLAHLVDLGVTHVELMPVVEFPELAAGATTACTCSRPITATTPPMISSGSSTLATAAA